MQGNDKTALAMSYGEGGTRFNTQISEAICKMVELAGFEPATS